MDYTIFYKEIVEEEALAGHKKWDLFISAFNSNERVNEIFKSANAKEKHWLIFPEFNYDKSEYPTLEEGSKHFDIVATDIVDFFKQYRTAVDLTKFEGNFCIDITGFTRPSLIYFIRLLESMGIKKCDVLYTEPLSYFKNEETTFSELPKQAEPIPACSKVNPKKEKDVLIIASGYDYQLILKVANAKKACQTKCQIFGFPSLQPDMYQENRLAANKAAESMVGSHNYYAPANDPFVTAQTIQTIVRKNHDFTNLYLSPLSTKAQTLGFVLYYIYEGINKNVSIIFPYSEKYSKKTSLGAGKTWKYSIEFPKKQPTQ